MRDTDAAWAAGFLDGEGHFGVIMRSDGRFNVLIQAAQINIEPLQKLQKLFGGGIRLYTSTDKERARHRDCSYWQLQDSTKILQVLDAITPYLTVKKLHAPILREACLLMNNDRHELSTDELRLRVSVAEGMRILNKTGKEEE